MPVSAFKIVCRGIRGAGHQRKFVDFGGLQGICMRADIHANKHFSTARTVLYCILREADACKV